MLFCASEHIHFARVTLDIPKNPKTLITNKNNYKTNIYVFFQKKNRNYITAIL